MTEKVVYIILVDLLGPLDGKNGGLIGYESNGVENLERGESFVGFFGYNQNRVALDFALAFRSAWPLLSQIIYLFILFYPQ